MTPLGLLYIGGALIDDNHDVKLIDASKMNLLTKDIFSIIKKEKPDVVCSGSSASTATIKKSLSILKNAKKVNSKIITVLGGIHPTFTFPQIIKNHPEVDYIIRGEGEITIKELLRALNGDYSLNKVNGLVWRKEKGYVVNPDREPIKNLDSVHAAWELIKDWEVYKNGVTNEKMAVVGFSRGCPFFCEFCGQWNFWKIYRTRNPKLFVDELELLSKKYGVTHFFFADENPSFDQKLWLQMLKEVVSRNLQINMIMNLRVSDVVRDKEYLPLYKKSGIVIVDLGVELTEQHLLNELRKGTTIYENKQAIAYLKKHDILTIVNLLVGDRYETKNSLNMKFKTVSEWDPDLVLPYIFTPYPWTQYYKKNKAWIKDWNYQNWNYVYPVIDIEGYDKDEFIGDILDNIFKFHLRKYLYALFFVKDKYRRKSIKAFILKPAVHYFYQRHQLIRSIIKGLFVKEPSMIKLYGKGV